MTLNLQISALLRASRDDACCSLVLQSEQSWSHLHTTVGLLGSNSITSAVFSARSQVSVQAVAFLSPSHTLRLRTVVGYQPRAYHPYPTTTSQSHRLTTQQCIDLPLETWTTMTIRLHRHVAEEAVVVSDGTAPDLRA